MFGADEKSCESSQSGEMAWISGKTHNRWVKYWKLVDQIWGQLMVTEQLKPIKQPN